MELTSSIKYGFRITEHERDFRGRGVAMPWRLNRVASPKELISPVSRPAWWAKQWFAIGVMTVKRGSSGITRSFLRQFIKLLAE